MFKTMQNGIEKGIQELNYPKKLVFVVMPENKTKLSPPNYSVGIFLFSI